MYKIVLNVTLCLADTISHLNSLMLICHNTFVTVQGALVIFVVT